MSGGHNSCGARQLRAVTLISFYDGKTVNTKRKCRPALSARCLAQTSISAMERIAFTDHLRDLPIPAGVFDVSYQVRRYF